MNPSDLSAEYASIKNYCRKEAAKSFQHPLAPKPEAAPEPTTAEEPQLTDDDLEALLSEE